MDKRYLFKVVMAVAVVFVVTVVTIVSMMIVKSNEMQGKLVFASTYDDGENVDKIVITTAEDVIELNQNDSFWTVKNKDGYFADFTYIHKLLTSINTSVYSIKLPFDDKLIKEKYLVNPEVEKEGSGMLIRTYVGDELLDELIIGLSDEDGTYFYARSMQDDIWMIDGQFDLPITSEGWLLKPILSIPKGAIETIKIGENYISRSVKNGDFFDEKGMKVSTFILEDLLSGLNVFSAVKEENFKKQSLTIKKEKQFEIETFYGLKFILNLYIDGNNIGWLNIKLSKTPLPIASVNDYIRDNSFLYDGWFFALYPSHTKILENFNLI